MAQVLHTELYPVDEEPGSTKMGKYPNGAYGHGKAQQISTAKEFMTTKNFLAIPISV